MISILNFHPWLLNILTTQLQMKDRCFPKALAGWMGRDGAVQDSAFRMSKTGGFSPSKKSPVDCLQLVRIQFRNPIFFAGWSGWTMVNSLLIAAGLQPGAGLCTNHGPGPQVEVEVLPKSSELPSCRKARVMDTGSLGPIRPILFREQPVRPWAPPWQSVMLGSRIWTPTVDVLNSHWLMFFF